jgi:hypothetical protein
MHLTLLVLLPAFAWLTWWQLSRAQSGNTLSWAYVVLWPSFGAYAVYTWWQLIHDQAARVPGRVRAPAAGSTTGVPGPTADGCEDGLAARPPGWALSGGRTRNVAIAASAPIDAGQGGRGERFTPQTPEEADRLAEYNRYLAELAAADVAGSSS